MDKKKDSKKMNQLGPIDHLVNVPINKLKLPDNRVANDSDNHNNKDDSNEE